MDAKITKKRLGEFFSYEWIKILALAVAIILVWSLLFSFTGARLAPDQLFTVINYSGTKVGDDFNEYPSTLLKNNVFSYEIDEISLLDVTAGENANQSGSLLDSRLTTGEGDVMYVSGALTSEVQKVVVDEDGNPILDGEGKTQYEKDSYMRAFLNSSYYYCVLPIEDVNSVLGEQKGLLTLVDEYLSRYFTKTGDVFDSTLDEERMEKDFRARVEETKDKRFRNETLIREGLQKEKARLQQYREGYEKFKGYLGDLITTTSSTLYLSDGEQTLKVTGTYGLNLCPDDRMRNLQSAVFYYNEIPDGDSSKWVKEVKDMHLLFLHLPGSRTEYLCEKILFVNHLVDRYKA